MVNERAIALDNITSKNKKYKKISDGTVIGVDILNDLSKYAELNLKRSYKIDISKWVVHLRNISSESTQEITNEIMRSLLQGKYKDNQAIINANDDKAITDDLEKFVILDDTSLIEKYKKYVTFNSIIVIKDNDGKDVYLTPSIYDNDDPKEIAIADNDLMILNKIFKDKHSKSIDDMVLNSFYKEINDKLDNIKNIILEASPKGKGINIKKYIKDDIYNKLFALYDIKNYTIINATALQQTKEEIDERSNKLSDINNYVKGGAGINRADIDDIIRMFKKNFNILNKVISEEIPAEVKEKIFKKDIEAINGIINEISSQVKDLNDTGNDAKNYKLYEQMLEKKEENIKKLVSAYETYKRKIINNIDDNINLKNKKLHPSKTFYESSDLNKLKYDTSRDKYKLLFNYIESLKYKRKTGGALEKDDKKEKNNVNTNFMHDAKSRLGIFKSLQRIYIDLVTYYYEIIEDPGEEENHTNFLHNDLDIDGEKANVKNHLLKILKKYNDKIYYFIEDLNKIEENASAKITNIKSSTLLNKIKDYYNNISVDTIKRNIHNKNSSILALFEQSAENINDIIKQNTNIPDSKSKNQAEDFPINEDITIDDIDKYIAEKNFDDIMSQLKSEIDKIKQNSKKPEKDDKSRELFNETNISKKKATILKRIKTLDGARPKIKKSLKDLYENIIKIRSSNLSENEDYITILLKSHKLSLFENDQDGSNHPILKSIKNEIDTLTEIKTKNEEELNIIEKERKAKMQKGIVYSSPYSNPLHQNSEESNEKGKSKNGGGVSNKNEYIYDESRQNDLDIFKEKHQDMYNLIKVNNNSIDTKEKYNFGNLMSRLKNDNKYFEAQEELSNKNTNKINPEISSEKSNKDYVENIYETIWKDYNESLGIGANKASIALSNINSNESLHNKVIVNNLDPELVLKISFQDKAIFLLLAFIIRTISVVILEFLIEHNIIKTLQGSIVFYGFTYLFILFLVVFLVNYDSYKLRILLNYLNIHINASNLILQNILFIIFITLIFILVNSDDILKYFGTVFDYTNIYGSIYDYRSSFEEDSDFNLSHSEKLKLLYRTDILSMIIFIFTGFIVLIL